MTNLPARTLQVRCETCFRCWRHNIAVGGVVAAGLMELECLALECHGDDLFLLRSLMRAITRRTFAALKNEANRIAHTNMCSEEGAVLATWVGDILSSALSLSALFTRSSYSPWDFDESKSTVLL